MRKIFSKPSLMIIYHFIATGALIYVLIYGRWFHLLALLIAHYIHVSWCSSATYHRLLAHKSWNAPIWFERICTLIAVTGCYGSSIAWVSIHREHHRYSDTEKDPHSPHTHTLFDVVYGVFYHAINVKLVTDLLRSPFHVFVHKHYFKILYGVPVIAFLILDPMWAATLTLAQGSLSYLTAGGMLNTICHFFGYQNFSTNDKSTNNIFLGYALYGEGWHNNHHHAAQNKQFGGVRWWEFDPTYLFIKLIEKK